MKLLLVAALLASAQERAPQLCSISGRAIDAVTGAPLSKVQIRLQQPGARNAPLDGTSTDAEGRFAMSGIAPGTYLLKGARSGYLEAAFGARRAGGAGTPLRIEAGQDAAALELKLHRFGVIAGTVRDRDGEPLSGVAIKLWRWKYDAESNVRFLDGGPVILTDDLGQYRAANLLPGKYYVEASPLRAAELTDRSAGERRMEIDLTTFFPNALSSATAVQVEVTAGARVTGTDITLARSRVYRVRGVALSEPGILAPVFVQLTVGRPGIDVWDHGYSAQVNRGEFEFTGVPSGSYRMLARSMRAGISGIFYDSWTRVDVSGADVSGLRVVVGPGAEVTGTITGEGDVKVSPGTWSLSITDETSSGGATVVTPDGAFVSHLSDGHYFVRFRDYRDPTLLLKSATVGSEDVLKDGLTINGPVKLRMEVVVSKAGGSVEGTALDADSKELAGATVLLAPHDLARVDLVRVAMADQLGGFAFKGVPPGEYRVFAFNDVEAGAWLEREFWKGREGEAVTVKTKAVAAVRVKASE